MLLDFFVAIVKLDGGAAFFSVRDLTNIFQFQVSGAHRIYGYKKQFCCLIHGGKVVRESICSKSYLQSHNIIDNLIQFKFFFQM